MLISSKPTGDRNKFRSPHHPARIDANWEIRRLKLHEENWLPPIWSLESFTAVPNAVGDRRIAASIDLAVEAERLGMDGAYFRVHHFAQQLASPFPLLAAVGAKTQKIEIGTAVIDMRYENPHYMAEDAGAADLISGGRLQLGISRGSPRAGHRWVALFWLPFD
jgi:alkanesulfonate monooxygenase SsuD/methylene tetrahydromethanopterin reductase-like flavin-dependent oxidoreductase (luciferase family)